MASNPIAKYVARLREICIGEQEYVPTEFEQLLSGALAVTLVWEPDLTKGEPSYVSTSVLLKVLVPNIGRRFAIVEYADGNRRYELLPY